jgi:hypothetical protein
MEEDPEIQVGSSIDIPIITKKIYWATLGALFIFIGAVPLLMETFMPGKYSMLIFAIIFFVIWLLISVWLFLIVSVPRTRVLEDGLYVRSIFLRRGKWYGWTTLEAFSITQMHLTGRFFLFLYLPSQDGRVKFGLGKRDPKLVSKFLRQSAKLVERGSIEGVSCVYHPQKPAIASCERCGAFICRDCYGSKIYSYFLSNAPHLTIDLACMPCIYKQYKKGSKLTLYLGLISGIFLLALPYNGWVLGFNSINAILAPIFLGVAIGVFLANKKRLKLIKVRVNSFNYEQEDRLTNIYLVTSLILSMLIPIRLIFLGTLSWAGYTFDFTLSTIPFVIIHQCLQWIVYLKLRP